LRTIGQLVGDDVGDSDTVARHVSGVECGVPRTERGGISKIVSQKLDQKKGEKGEKQSNREE
jgi:hypothetical protein